MSMAGELGGFLGRAAGVTAEPLFWIAAPLSLLAGYARRPIAIALIPLAVTVLVSAVNWSWWGSRAPIAALQVFLAHLTWAAILYLAGFVARRARGRAAA